MADSISCFQEWFGVDPFDDRVSVQIKIFKELGKIGSAFFLLSSFHDMGMKAAFKMLFSSESEVNRHLALDLAFKITMGKLLVLYQESARLAMSFGYTAPLLTDWHPYECESRGLNIYL